MNARKISTIIILIAAACVTQGGKLPPPTASFNGVWAGYNGLHGPGATGASLSFSADNNVDRVAAGISANATPITGSIVVPLVGDGGFETRPITGFITAKGRVHGKFKGGSFNGHLDRGNHDAAGFISVNVQSYRAIGYWFADQPAKQATLE